MLSKYDYAFYRKKDKPVSEVIFLDRELTRLSKDAQKSETLMWRAALHDLLLGQQLNDHITDKILENFLDFPYIRLY